MTSTGAGPGTKEIAATLREALMPLGFVSHKRGSRFYLSDRARCVVVELQKSTKSTASTSVFTVNVGLWNATLAEKLGGPASAGDIGAMDCHWWLRAGQLDKAAQGRWWTVGSGDDAAAVASELWSSVSPAVALLAQFKDDATFLAYLLAVQGPFLDPMNRWAFALALASAAGDRKGQFQATNELNGLGRSRTLPIGHKLLLQSSQELLARTS